jgi:2,4-dienoyl-CoA reductase-like NADH-dependent reductase (Old Yellow Enzyme family)
MLDIAYLHTGNFDDKVIYPELENSNMTRFIRKYYTGKVIACGAYSVDEARAGLAAKDFDLIAYGRPFIANPDLITKISNALPVKEYDAGMLEQLV